MVRIWESILKDSFVEWSLSTNDFSQSKTGWWLSGLLEQTVSMLAIDTASVFVPFDVKRGDNYKKPIIKINLKNLP